MNVDFLAVSSGNFLVQNTGNPLLTNANSVRSSTRLGGSAISVLRRMLLYVISFVESPLSNILKASGFYLNYLIITVTMIFLLLTISPTNCRYGVVK